MLTRTISKHKNRTGHFSWLRLAGGFGIFLMILLAALIVPQSMQRVRDLPLSDEELKTQALALSLSGDLPLTVLESKKAALGRDLFSDKGLSGNGQTSCSSCHMPEKFFSDGSPQPSAGPMAGTEAGALLAHTPALGNGRLIRWANGDGSGDSLGAQALSSLEDPRFMASSRLHVVQHVAVHHLAAYEEAFGPLPQVLKRHDLPPHGLPVRTVLRLPIEISARALATLTGKGQLLDILGEAQRARIAPAMELSQRALASPVPPIGWISAYDGLDNEVKAAVNQVFASVGQAVAAYERQLVSSPSVFDRFAIRLAAGDTVEQAMQAASFSESQLTGFKLFVGPAGCIACHAGSGLSDQKFHNLGLPSRGGPIRLGRAVGALTALNDEFNCYSGLFASETAPSNDETSRCPTLETIDVTDVTQVGAYKTPSLRNAAMTGPYMHDGRYQTMTEVLEFYSHLEGMPEVGDRDPSLKPLHLTNEEMAVLEGFLRSLTSPLRDVGAEAQVSLLP